MSAIGTAPSATEPRARVLRWPPPGLERVQGDLWRIAARGALGGATLVLPLLFVAARQHEVSSLGPFADAWWVSLVLAAVGLGFSVDTLTSTGRFLRRAARAIEGGYDPGTIASVAADQHRDTGFLLQGARHFSVMEPAERRALARLRVAGAACHVAAGLWLPVVLALALFLAARGAFEHTTLWGVTLLPAGLAYLVGGVLGLIEDGRVRRARAAWFAKPWASDLDAGEIARWRAEMDEGAAAPSSVRFPGLLRRSATAIGVATVVVAVPILTLIPTSAVGPILAMIAAPRFGQAHRRAADAEAYREYRVEPDASVSPQEAGSLLQVLLFVGSDRDPAPGEREPARRWAEPWLPVGTGPNPTGVEPHRWPEELFARAAADPTPELRAYLQAIAGQPAQADFARFASAPDLDAAAGRWVDAFPVETTIASVPIPRFSALREAAWARIAAAAWDRAEGRPADAERKLREVVSAGFLLGDHGPTLIDNLIGHTLVAAGGTALRRFYEAEGRSEDASRLASLEAAAGRAGRRIRTPPVEGIEAYVRALPAMVEDTTMLRGFRWEYFILTTTLTPCLNLHRMVFGPDEPYRLFEERARAGLVRWPSEEKLFELARAGFWGGGDRESLFGRVLGVSMRAGEGSCSQVVRRFDALREVM